MIHDIDNIKHESLKILHVSPSWTGLAVAAQIKRDKRHSALTNELGNMCISATVLAKPVHGNNKTGYFFRALIICTGGATPEKDVLSVKTLKNLSTL
jgi:hypothetical protein